MTSVFVAYASGNDFHSNIINEASADVSNRDRNVKTWSDCDTSGSQISLSVEQWIAGSDYFIADVSYVNMNVTYELGYAIGLEKPIRLIRSTHAPIQPIRDVGLLDSLGHDEYDFQPKLRTILKKKIDKGAYDSPSKNKDQPVFVLQPEKPNIVSRKTISAIKKIARYRFRNFNPAEISRLSALEAFESVSSSFGIVTTWLDEDSPSAVTNNQRSAFIFGLARGIGIPALLIAHESTELPLDVQDFASRWERLDHIDALVQGFRDDVADELIHFSDPQIEYSATALKKLDFGDPVAENEQSRLRDFFLETDAYSKTLTGDAHVLVGRKGSGKSAIFLQVRDRCRANKQNIVVDLMPEGYQLIKLKEYILDKLHLGTKKQVISAFWEYIIWLEIAYKLLEKDRSRAKRDPAIFSRYERLYEMFHGRVDTGIGDFSERLKLLSENIISRFEEGKYFDSSGSLDSSKVLEVIYGEDVSEMREIVLSYLEAKGYVFFLFDNLDRIWTPGGFNQADAVILVGLAEAMQEIARRFTRKQLDFRWALFIRSDVYEFLIRGMADYGKLATQSIEWSDRDQLKALFNQRLTIYDEKGAHPVSINTISENLVDGVPVVDFLIDKSLMRPRYLIRLFETARRRALTLGRPRIIEDDYTNALGELGWQVLEDLDREVSDLVDDGTNLLFELLSHKDDLTPEKIRYIAGRTIDNSEQIEKLIDVLIWNGSLGVNNGKETTYIFDCGYRRQYLSSLIDANDNVKLALHPTLCATLESA